MMVRTILQEEYINICIDYYTTLLGQLLAALKYTFHVTYFISSPYASLKFDARSYISCHLLIEADFLAFICRLHIYLYASPGH